MADREARQLEACAQVARERLRNDALRVERGVDASLRAAGMDAHPYVGCALAGGAGFLVGRLVKLSDAGMRGAARWGRRALTLTGLIT